LARSILSTPRRVVAEGDELMSEEQEKSLTGTDADAQPTRPDPEMRPYRQPADIKGARALAPPDRDDSGDAG
jgi:hypothetical protein